MAWSREAMSFVLVAVLLFTEPAISTPVPPLITMRTNGGDQNPPVSLAQGLRPDFYDESCPDVHGMVQTAVLEALEEDIAVAAGLLRIFFHDCFPQGCDASILLTGTISSEQRMPPNRGLQPKALQLIDDIRAKVQAVCGPVVSCADITSLATHDAVIASGGKPYYVPLGRLDSLRPAAWSYVHDLPHFTADMSRVIDAFSSRKFFDVTDVVALSGAHSIGKAHCNTFAHRFGKEDSEFVQRLAANCTADVHRLQDLDVNTPNMLDNMYYKNVLEGKGVLATDQLLSSDNRTNWLVDNLAQDEWWFWNQFGTSMSKMGRLQGYFGNVGEVRRVSCSASNPAEYAA